MDRQLIIIGGGRNAVETFYLLEDIGEAGNVKAFVQDVVEPGKHVLNIPVRAVSDVLMNSNNAQRPIMIGAIGDINDNKRLIELFLKNGFDFFSAINTEVPHHRQNYLGKGISIAQGTTNIYHIVVIDGHVGR